MIATLTSLVTVIFLFFFPSLIPDLSFSGFFVLAAGILSLLALGVLGLLPLTALQKAEVKATPRVMEMFRNLCRVRGFVFVLFFMFSLVFFLLSRESASGHSFLLAVWFIFFAVVIDLFIDTIHNVHCLLNPFDVILKYRKKVEDCELKDEYGEACSWIAALAETSTKALYRGSSTLGIQAVNEMRKTGEDYLERAKDIENLTEERLYLIHFIIQNLESIYHQAIDEENDPISMAVVTTLGKVIIVSVRCQVPITDVCIHILRDFVDSAEEEAFAVTAIKISCAFEEVAKAIVADPKVESLIIKDSLVLLIEQMDKMAKEVFRRDKTIDIGGLLNPFYELQKIIKPMDSHPDQPVVLAEIDRVIGEFVALQQVMAGKERAEKKKGK